MIRDIFNNKGKFISIVLILAVGSFMFSGLLGSIRNIQDTVNNFYEDQNMADIWAYYSGITENNLNEYRQQDDIDEVEGRYSFQVEAEHTYRFLSLTSINQVEVVEGKMPEVSKKQILIDKSYASSNSIEVGEYLRIDEEEYYVSGLCIEPEFAYKTKTALGGNVETRKYALIFAHSDDILEYSKGTLFPNIYFEILIKSNDIPVTIEYLNTNAISSRLVDTVSIEDHPSYKMVDNAIAPVEVVSNIIPFIVYFVAAAITLIAMTKTIDNERMQIGIIQGLGISKEKIIASYIFYVFVASLLGSLLFAVFGNMIVPKILSDALMSRYALPEFKMHIYFDYAILTLLLSFFFSAVAVLLSLAKVMKEVPAQAMRPKQAKKMKKIMLEKTPIWKRLSYSSKLIARNIFCGKIRILLSSIGVIGGVMLLSLGFHLNQAVDSAISPLLKSLQYDVSAVYLHSVDKDYFTYEDTECELMKMIEVTYSEDDLLMNVQIVEDNSQLVYLETPSKKKIELGEGIAVTRAFSETYSVSTNDIISLEYNSKVYDFNVAEIVEDCVNLKAYMSYSYAEQMSLPTESQVLLIKTDHIDEVVNLLKEDPNLVSYELAESLNKMAQSYTSILQIVVLILLISSAVLTITVIYNISSINLFERTREFATLMVLGYYKKEIKRVLFVENVVLVILGCIFGIPCGILLFRYIIDALSRTSLFLSTSINPLWVIVTIILSFIFLFISNILVEHKLQKIQMVESLKSVE